jgi:prevent-host-death family protein
MKSIPAGLFKSKCLAIMDEVHAKRATVVITKRGKPIAKLVPAEPQIDDIYDFLAGKGAVTADVVPPVLSLAEWGELK